MPVHPERDLTLRDVKSIELLGRLDRAAAASGETRSGLIARVVREAITQ
jgi:hypothetical protein